MIKAENVSKEIAGRLILKDINLAVQPGEFVTVLGPNGAGKTTLLKILSLVLKPSQGKVYIDGREAGEADRALRRKIGVISHNTFLYDNLSAYENLAFYGKLYGVPRLKERIEAVLEEVGLRYALHDPVRTFSRGMQQRLAIARAILHEPVLLFLDEPYTGLDQHAIDILNGVLRRLVDHRRTIFMVTHNYEQGLELSQRVVILNKGRLVYSTETDGLTGAQFKELYRRYVGGVQG
ncbi:MAG TPA: heme ABC exporter ATP-binding protein CcmA [Clostridia bacterium]|nr:heme ABC exporter ATP-binding protein CcmA [Clostridia bacterium]